MVKIFDSHAHYDDSDFDVDRESLLSSMKDKGVYRIVNIGASLESSRATCELTKQYEDVFGAVGIHPSDAQRTTSSDPMGELRNMYESHKDKIVAIGEIGLDYHYPDTDKVIQEKFFVDQLNLARELELPVVIHSRDAANDTVEIMKKEKASEIGGVVHCFSYTKEMAKIFLDMGFYIGVGGVLTFSNAKKLKEALTVVPMDKIVVETDCPYLAPSPYRGQRNESDYITYVVNVLAGLKGVSEDEVYEITYNNAMKLYRM